MYYWSLPLCVWKSETSRAVYIGKGDVGWDEASLDLISIIHRIIDLTVPCYDFTEYSSAITQIPGIRTQSLYHLPPMYNQFIIHKLSWTNKMTTSEEDNNSKHSSHDLDSPVYSLRMHSLNENMSQHKKCNEIEERQLLFYIIYKCKISPAASGIANILCTTIQRTLYSMENPSKYIKRYITCNSILNNRANDSPHFKWLLKSNYSTYNMNDLSNDREALKVYVQYATSHYPANIQAILKFVLYNSRISLTCFKPYRKKKYLNPEDPRDAEEIMNILENLSDDDEICSEIDKADDLNLILLPPQDGQDSDCDDAPSDDERLTNFRDIGKGVLLQPLEVQAITRSEQIKNKTDVLVQPSTSSESNNGAEQVQRDKRIPRQWLSKELDFSVDEEEKFTTTIPELFMNGEIIKNWWAPVDIFKLVFNTTIMEFICKESVKIPTRKILSKSIGVVYSKLIGQNEEDSFGSFPGSNSFVASDAACVKDAQVSFNDKSVQLDLIYIKSNFGKLPATITKLETTGLPLVQSLAIVEELQMSLHLAGSLNMSSSVNDKYLVVTPSVILYAFPRLKAHLRRRSLFTVILENSTSRFFNLLESYHSRFVDWLRKGNCNLHVRFNTSVYASPTCVSCKRHAWRRNADTDGSTTLKIIKSLLTIKKILLKLKALFGNEHPIIIRHNTTYEIQLDQNNGRRGDIMANGVMKGDPISPLLLNIMAADIGTELSGTMLKMYADDIALESDKQEL
ncbi:hypothetical protein C0J52_18120 [Blattella germanica]|nr:hypothetical protein C0J52_18120 [Blattella germanica]